MLLALLLSLYPASAALERLIDPSHFALHSARASTSEIKAYEKSALEKHRALIKQLRHTARTSTEHQPLTGLRIALDPGHVASAGWDERTGKFVKLQDGRKVSEAELNREVALLLSEELSKLGAYVYITGNNFAPIKPFNFSADLASRANAINAFRPHLTLILHFDAHDNAQLQSRMNHTRAYVYGNLQKHDFATPQSRAVSLRAIAEAPRWMESNVFSASIVKKLADAAKLDLKTSPKDVGGYKIANGVYARNLMMPKLITEGAVCYLEALSYNYRAEFERLIRQDRTANLYGYKFHYSSRLDDVVRGVKLGVLDYVASHK